MVNNILNPPKKVIKHIELGYKTSNDFDNDTPLIDEQLNENKEKNIESINDNESNNEKKYSNENNSDTSSFALNKLCFYDFFFNNIYSIYSKCCKRMRNQEIINMTNKIVYKYLSIDSMLISQMKLENLFKDYKWNNPLLNNVQNNIMIDELKNI